MADKKSKSRALKAVNDTKKKTGNPTTSVKKKEVEETPRPQAVKEELPVSRRAFGAIAAFVLFVVFLFMGIKPEGALMRVMLSLLTGLVGKVGFYFSIPALLYLFAILVSSKGRPVRMRSVCLMIFVLCSSCVHHLIVNNQTFVGGLRIVKDLYDSGVVGTSGGLICGLLAMLVRWACGNVFAYVIFITVAVFTLLASMKITIPSIIRAIQNRPRDNWQDDIAADKPEPAAVVVNHLANKRIEQNRQKRQKKELAELAYDGEQTQPQKVTKAQKVAAAAQPVALPESAPMDKDRAAKLMSQIADFDVPEKETADEDMTVKFVESAKPVKPEKKPAKV